MYSNNRKISIRQIGRLLILDLFGAGSLLLPGLLAKTAGADGVFCIVAATIVAIGYLWILGKVLQQQQEEYCSWIRQTVGNIAGDIILIFYLFFFLLLAAFLLYQLTGLVRVWLLPGGSYGWIQFLILILAAYGTLRGIEGRARIYEILFWFLGAPLLLMLFLAARDVNVDYWTPVMYAVPEDFGKGVLLAFVFFLPAFFIPFQKYYCSKPQRLTGCARKSVIMAGLLNIVVFLILIGNFQVKTTAILERPVITLMSMVKLPGGFFARMDAFMTAIWFFSLFALMNTGIFYASHILKEMFHEKKTQYGLLAVMILTFSATQWFWEYPGAVKVYEKYVLYIGLWGILGIPLLVGIIAWIRGNRDRKTGNRNVGLRKKWRVSKGEE